MQREVNLEEILLSTDAAAAWAKIEEQIVIELQNIGKDETDEDGDVWAVVDDEGTLTISVTISDFIDESLDIPMGHWGYFQ
jgi:hypothetical protein